VVSGRTRGAATTTMAGLKQLTSAACCCPYRSLFTLNSTRRPETGSGSWRESGDRGAGTKTQAIEEEQPATTHSLHSGAKQ